MRKTGAVLLGVLLAAALPGRAKETSGASPSREWARQASPSRERARQASPSFKVVVNPAVSGRKIQRDALAQIFLGKAERWGDGRPIVPVDLSSTSAVREAFTERVLGMPIDGVKAYWMRSVAARKRPPKTMASDLEVLTFVAAEPGAVGYVSETTPVPPTVRVVDVE